MSQNNTVGIFQGEFGLKVAEEFARRSCPSITSAGSDVGPQRRGGNGKERRSPKSTPTPIIVVSILIDVTFVMDQTSRIQDLGVSHHRRQFFSHQNPPF